MLTYSVIKEIDDNIYEYKYGSFGYIDYLSLGLFLTTILPFTIMLDIILIIPEIIVLIFYKKFKVR